MIRVTIWNENVQEHRCDDQARRIAEIYPNGIHEALRGILAVCEDMRIRTVTMQQPECGLPEAVLEDTDVLVWWAHVAHDQVPDAIAQRVRDHVLLGMGLIALHSAHPSKPLQLLLGTSCSLLWHENDFCRVWTVKPSHP
ncbi:MAG: ThuA domain-containing protein, partial [Clostridia bacterium]